MGNCTFETKRAILGFPLWLLKPLFCLVILYGYKKGAMFQKQIVATEMCVFLYLPNTIMFAYFSENATFSKTYCSQPPQKLFSGLLLKFCFSICFFHLFGFSNIKRQNKKCFFDLRKPLIVKKLFSHPYTLCVIFKIPPNTINLGEKQAKTILDQVFTQPWTKF